MKTLVSTLALGLSLAVASPVLAATPAAPTAADADKFVADAEKVLGDFSVYNAQVQWINNTYITDDTDAVAAKVGAEGTEMAVKYAAEAARYMQAPGLSAETKRKLDILRGGLVLPAPALPAGRRPRPLARPGCRRRDALPPRLCPARDAPAVRARRAARRPRRCRPARCRPRSSRRSTTRSTSWRPRSRSWATAPSRATTGCS